MKSANHRFHLDRIYPARRLAADRQGGPDPHTQGVFSKDNRATAGDIEALLKKGKFERILFEGPVCDATCV
jgi:hypothetical protein